MRHLIFTFFLLHTGAAHAALINNDIYTTDSITNLDWLDLTATLGLKSSDIRYELSTKWDNELHTWVPSTFMGGGWRFANESEAVDLVTRNIGADFGYYLNGTAQAINGNNLINLLGITHHAAYPTGYFTAGLFVNNNNELNLIKIEQLLRIGTIGNEDLKFIKPPLKFAWSSTGGTAVGKFLVREHLSPVPLPPSLLLFITGIGILLTSQLTATAKNASRYFKHYVKMH